MKSLKRSILNKKLFSYFPHPRIPLLLFFLGLFTSLCIAQPKKNSDNSAIESINTKRMTSLLKAHQLKADFRKLGGVFMNDKGIEYFKKDLKTADSSKVILIEADIAMQMLKAGKTEDAIELFKSILKKIRASPRSNLPSANIESEIKKQLALSYLRLGEQQNCVINHHAESCILPLKGRGIYSIKQSVREAIKLYSEIVIRNRNDYESRWLLNISYMTLGLYPDSVPSIYLVPFDTFDKPYAHGTFTDIAQENKLDETGLSGSAIVEDFDNDNDLDIFYVRLAFDAQCHFFVNNGDGTFTDKTLAAGLQGEVSGRSCVQADYNNDGYMDIFIARGAWEIQEDNLPPSSLLRNNGNGTFTDVTIQAGLLDFLPNYNACWFDYDNDGWIDLFLSNESADNQSMHAAKLFHNTHTGTFEEVAYSSGIQTKAWTKGVTAFDYNNDGWQDLYICTARASNILYKNNGKGKDGKVSFTNVTAETHTSGHDISFYTFPMDFNNDGWIDLYTSRSSFEYEFLTHSLVSDYLGKPSSADSHPKFYKNNKDGTFSEASDELKLNRVIYNMGINFGDIDNDGYLDIYAGTGNLILTSLFPNLMLRNHDGKFFEDVSAATGLGNLQHSHGIGFGDLDNDGDQDIYQVMGGNYSGDVYQNVLYENPGSPNHWVKLKLEGVESNKAAIGSRIKVNVQTPSGERNIYTTVTSGGSFGASTLRREIGIGDAEKINYTEITWSGSGKVQKINDLKIDSFYKITEGKETALEVKISRFVLHPEKRNLQHEHE